MVTPVARTKSDRVRTPGRPRSHCPINFGLEIFGDRWTLLVLRDLLLQHKRRFSDFLASEERIATNILSDRLRRLERSGLVEVHPSPSDRRAREYAPTAAARALVPVLVEMAFWGASHDAQTASPAAFAEAYRRDRAALLAFLAAGGDPTKEPRDQK